MKIWNQREKICNVLGIFRPSNRLFQDDSSMIKNEFFFATYRELLMWDGTLSMDMVKNVENLG